jgi:hypothetical protein
MDNGIVVKLIDHLIKYNRERYDTLCKQYKREYKNTNHWLSPGVMRYRDGYTGTLTLLKLYNDDLELLKALKEEATEQ